MIMKYTIQQAKRDFDLGYLTNYSIERTAMELNSWRLILGKGNSLGILVDHRTKQERLFKTADAAISALESIGFKVNQLGYK